MLKRKDKAMEPDYRILKNETLYGIYEVSYDKKGNPVSCDTFPIIEDESPEDLQIIVNKLVWAFGKEVLNYEDLK